MPPVTADHSFDGQSLLPQYHASTGPHFYPSLSGLSLNRCQKVALFIPPLSALMKRWLQVTPGLGPSSLCTASSSTSRGQTSQQMKGAVIEMCYLYGSLDSTGPLGMHKSCQCLNGYVATDILFSPAHIVTIACQLFTLPCSHPLHAPVHTQDGHSSVPHQRHIHCW